MQHTLLVSFNDDSSSQRLPELLIVSDIIKELGSDYKVSALYYVITHFSAIDEAEKPILYGTGDIILSVKGDYKDLKAKCLSRCHSDYKISLLQKITVSAPISKLKIKKHCDFITDKSPDAEFYSTEGKYDGYI